MSSQFAHQLNEIYFTKLNPEATIPTRGTPASAGFDLYALEDTLIVGGDGNVIVPTGVAVALPAGTYGRIAMRSGLAVKQHLSVSAGVIDADYRNSIGIVVYCTKVGHQYLVKKGERVAQLIPEKVAYCKSNEITSASYKILTGDSTHTGFGSTGKH